MTCVSFYKGDDDPEPSGRIPLEPTEAIKKLLVAVPPTEEDFKWANKQIAQLEAADRLQQTSMLGSLLKTLKMI